ncbi:hsp70-Hsp90 organizing protein-like isoform X2 [Apium graveolens]|uniref:hsp70-Hsp90 organizing protein-like isoform X2 n=1 Tax=Apium graveolens TaxID=4045 RepID=UPI003D78EE1E
MEELNQTWSMTTFVYGLKSMLSCSLQIRGFEKQMEKWMGACDCIISKVCLIFSPETIYLIQFQTCTNSASWFFGWTSYNCKKTSTEFEELVYKKKDFEKEAGNVAYKKKDFENAIKCYSQAVELDDTDISFLTNRAAVYLEMGKYEKCIKDCDKAVERGRKLILDFKMIAKALTRNGTALVKMAKCSKDYEPAIETFQKALTEHRNLDTLKKLNDAEKVKKDLEQLEYFDPKIADEEREKGNKFFKQQKYPEAIKQ